MVPLHCWIRERGVGMGCFRSPGAIRRACVGLMGLSLLVLTACDGAPSASAANDGNKTKANPTASPTADAPPLTLAVAAPAHKATKVITATDVVINTTGSVENVTLTSSDGKPVAGALAEDGKTWRPGVQLAYGANYKLSVKAKSGDEEKTVTSSFTTMARPGRIAGADIYFADGDTVGIGMPLVVEFSRDIPVAQRAAV